MGVVLIIRFFPFLESRGLEHPVEHCVHVGPLSKDIYHRSLNCPTQNGQSQTTERVTLVNIL